jgi:hypothetical protein
MNTHGYYDGCSVHISYNSVSRKWLDRAIAKFRSEYAGIKILAIDSPSCRGVEATHAFVPDGHLQDHAGRVDDHGNVIERWGAHLLLLAAEDAIKATADVAKG